MKSEPPTPEWLDRLIRSALQTFDQQFCQRVYRALTPATHAQLDTLLVPAGGEVTEDPTQEADEETGSGRTSLSSLRADAGAATLENLFTEIHKLKRLRALRLPPGLPEPANLLALKADVARCWPMTHLLDVLKETDLRVGFTQAFHSPTPREHLSRRDLRYRILLCLYRVGTNAGLKRVAAGQSGVAYKDLLYTRRRFIHKAQLRLATAEVVSHTLAAR